MRVAIVGSRNPSEYARGHVYTTVQALPHGTIVVSGGADGIDKLAIRLAELRGLPTDVLRPNYTVYAPSIAPKVRNTLIAATCDRMIAYTFGSKGGTFDAIRQARRFNLPVEVIKS